MGRPCLQVLHAKIQILLGSFIRQIVFHKLRYGSPVELSSWVVELCKFNAMWYALFTVKMPLLFPTHTLLSSVGICPNGILIMAVMSIGRKNWCSRSRRHLLVIGSIRDETCGVSPMSTWSWKPAILPYIYAYPISYSPTAAFTHNFHRIPDTSPCIRRVVTHFCLK